MKEHASTGAIPADASEEKLVNELAGMAYSYAVELDAATRDADHGELEAVSRRITGKLREAIRKALSGAQAVPAFPAIKGAWITGGYVIVTPAGSGPDKAQAVKAAILTAAHASLAHEAALDAAIDAARGEHDGRA